MFWTKAHYLKWGCVSAFASINSNTYSHMASHTHTHAYTQAAQVWTVFKLKFVSPFSLCCVAADSEKTDFDPLLSPSFRARIKGKVHLLFKDKLGLCHPPSFPLKHRQTSCLLKYPSWKGQRDKRK